MLTQRHYKGVLHRDSLRWCHGRVGLEHDKVRKFRYPLYKYSPTIDSSKIKIIICVCLNCNMIFNNNDKTIKLDIPIKKLDSYSPYPIAVKVNGQKVISSHELVTPFKQSSIVEINDDTRDFIELVQ